MVVGEKEAQNTQVTILDEKDGEITKSLAEFQNDYNKALKEAENTLKNQEKTEKAIQEKKKKIKELEEERAKNLTKIKGLESQGNKLKKQGARHQNKANKYLEDANKLIEENSEKDEKIAKFKQEIEESENALVKNTENAVTAAGRLGAAQEQILSAKEEQAVKDAKNIGVNDNQIEELQKQGDLEAQLFNDEVAREQALKEQEEAEQARLEAKKDQQQAYGLAIQGVTQSISGAAMAVQGFQALGSIWSNEDLSLGEKFSSSLMSITSIIGGVSQAMSGAKQMAQQFGKAIELSGVQTDKASKIKKAATQRDIANDNKKKASNLSTAISNIGTSFSEALKLPFPANIVVLASYIAVGASILSMIGGALGSIGQIAGIGNGKEENKKTAEADYEELNKTQETIEKNEKLANSYSQALKQFQTTGEGKEDLAKATLELAEAYDIEGAALANLSGDYSQFNKNLEKARKEENLSLKNASISSAKSFAKVIYDEDLLEKGWGGNGLGGNTFTDTLQSNLFNVDKILKESEYFSVNGKNIEIMANK